MLTVGNGLTVTAKDAAAALTQPAVLVPLKVYVIFDVGATDILLKLLLVLQVQVLAPDADKLILSPEHNALVPVILTTGKAFTVTVNAKR